MSGRSRSVVRPFAAVALVAAATVAVGLRPSPVSAAPPTFTKIPTRLYMIPDEHSAVIPDLLAGLAIPISEMTFDDVPLGGDVISRQSRVIEVDSTETAACDHHATDSSFSLTGCTTVKLTVNPTQGSLSFTTGNDPTAEDDPRFPLSMPRIQMYRFPSGALLEDAGDPPDFDKPIHTITGTASEINTTLKTLVFTPTVDDPGTANVDEDYYYTGIPGEGEMEVAVTNFEATEIAYVQIRVLDYNNFPVMTVPVPTWPGVASGADKELFVNAGPNMGDDPDQPTVLVADEDNDEIIDGQQADPPESPDPLDGDGQQFLLVAWTTCGQFALRSETGFGIVDDLNAIIDEVWLRAQDNGGAPPADKETVKAAFFAMLPDSVESLPFATGLPDDMHTAFAGIANDIDWLNWAVGQITFRAKDALGANLPDSTCKLRVLVSDLGNNGLPFQYIGEPNNGFEIPLFGVDLDTNYQPAVEELTIEVGAGGLVTPTITSVSDVTLAEGTGGVTTPFTFTLTLDAPAPAGGATVQVDTADGPAPAATTADSDYVAEAAQTVTFAPGATSATFTVDVNHNALEEPDEHFTLNLSNATGVTIGDPSGLGTVQNDDGMDPPPQVTTFTAQSKNEGTGAGTTAYDFTITLSAAAPAGGAAVRFATTHGTTDGTDLTTTAGQTVVFSAGQTSRTVTVQTNRDATPEPSETFTATLSNPDGVTIAAAAQSATATIVNDDLNTVSISDESVTEDDAPVDPTMTFDVTLSGPAVGNEVVLVTTGGGTAAAMVDYTPLTAVPVTFNPDEMSKPVTVVVKGDDFDESNETFVAVLNNPQNVAITDGFGIGTIIDDDTLTVSVADVTLAEGNAGETNFVFTLALNGPATAGTQVTVATADGSAVAGPLPDDYTAVNQLVSFMTGSQSATVTVPVHGDGTQEGDDTFTLTLSNPVNVAIADGQAIGTIQNDDGAAASETVTIGDVTELEGDAGTTTFTFTLNLPGGDPAEGGEEVTATVTHGTTDDTDLMLPAATVVTFASMATSATFNVTVNGDLVLEPDETFNVTLSAPNGLLISDMVATGTVENDDEAKHVTSISDVALAEGNLGTTAFVFTLTLDGPAGDLESVVATTTHGPAPASDDTDFIDGMVPVVFTPGLSTATATVNITADVTPEVDENFTLTLSAPQNLVLDDTTANGTIQNDDGAQAPPQIIALGDVTLLEGDVATTAFVFTLTLDKPAVGGESVDVTTAHGPLPATDDNDLTPLTAQTVTFAAMATQATVTVLVDGDTDVEVDEQFTVTLGNPQGVTIAAAAQSATGTVQNDDVVVQPPDPLTITAPADITVTAGPGESGAVVSYPAPTTTGGVPPVSVSCDQPSGGFYVIGTTTVTCTATDSDQSQQQLTLATVSDSFTITVLASEPTTTTSSTTTPPVTPPSTPAPPSSTVPDVGGLPETGGDTAPLLVIAATVLIAGFLLVQLRRRSRPAG